MLPKLVVRNGRMAVELAPNFVIHVKQNHVKPLDSKHALVWLFSGEPPILAEVPE
ncbi:MAG: hypothetical protein LM558_01000 [Thermosphaera sp.]|nr:hypothetical protein [Thermosphaera sp.]